MLTSCLPPGLPTFSYFQVNYTKVAGACNMARNHHDVQDSWDSVLKIIEFYGENEGGFAETAGPGYWNDPDQVA